MTKKFLLAGAAALFGMSVAPAFAEDINLRIGSGHPPGVVYAGLMQSYFQPELKKRVEERTDHTINFVEGYSGSIVKVTEVLELSETQTAVLDRIAEDILDEHSHMETRREEFKDRFFEALGQEQVAAEDLMLLFEEKKPHIDRLMQLAAGHIAEFHSILTPEQRTRLITEMENHRHRCRFSRWTAPTQEIEG